ncbi:MAG: hypothetical protein AAB482_02535 [Patescibacteria group bacterium]
MKNTLENAQVRYVIFKENDKWYGAALEVNIVESGNSPEEVLFLLNEAMTGYFLTARDIADVGVLNQDIDPEYEAMWNEASKVPLTPNIFDVGKRNFASAWAGV